MNRFSALAEDAQEGDIKVQFIALVATIAILTWTLTLESKSLWAGSLLNISMIFGAQLTLIFETVVV